MAPRQARQIEWLDVSELAPDPLNPKTHDLPTIQASIGRFGMLEPVVIDGRTQQILSGHGRVVSLVEAHERGDVAPEGIRVGPEGQWLTPAVTGWSSANDDEAHAALVALNRTTELGGWDERALLTMLETLDESEGGLTGVGYAGDDLAILREAVFTDDQRNFLGDMTEGHADNPFNPAENNPTAQWAMGDRIGETSLQFPMSKDQRTACVAKLRDVMAAQQLDTMTDALLLLLGLPVSPSVPPPAGEPQEPEGEGEGALASQENGSQP